MKHRVLFLIGLLCLLSGCSNNDSSIDSSNGIMDSFKSIADSVNYDFDPTSVVSKEYRVQDGDSFRAMNYDEVIEYSKNSPGVDEEYFVDGVKQNIFMKFDGYYRDAYSGKVIIYEAHLTLWENGIFTASITDEEVDRHGVWYNELSLDSKKGLKLVYPKLKTVVSGSSRTLSEIECNLDSETSYDYLGRLPFETKNKEEELLIKGYYYSPEIGFYLDDHNIKEFKLSRLERNIANAWDPYLVLKDLRTLPLDDKTYEVVKYEIDDIETCGTKVVKVRYKDYLIEKTIEVIE